MYRLRCANGSCVVKLGAAEREVAFYTSVAPELAQRDVAAPTLLLALGKAGERALLLEDVARLLPRERWLADAAVAAYLRRLHALTPADLPLAEPFRPHWTASMSRALARLLPAGAEGTLRRLQRRSAPLFAASCVISGDPNPTNWGMRADGTLVLFDWERVGYGTPALDLAITVPGLGTPDEFIRVAGGVLTRRAGHEPATPDEARVERQVERLARDIAIAKVWVVAEYVTMVPEGDERASLFAELLPARLERIVACCEARRRGTVAV